ncbi:glycoside hydrolase superfamily [Chytriomyces sp. MP71]|nr:glycoside hydrolase superfamily [Chytriomyces sp. MP71]
MRRLASVALVSGAAALDNGVGRSPAMGWNSWNRYGCRVNEELIKQAADYLVDSGLHRLGYEYVNVDDCWQATRDSNGRIHENPLTFPSGMQSLADYVHAKGLKFGLYSSAGTFTCQGKPGGLGFEVQDAKIYADWGVDYFKYDNCNNEGMSDKRGTIERYGALRDALNATGRHINYAICNWGQANIWEYGNSLGNSWRTTGGIEDKWDSVMEIIHLNLFLGNYSEPGGFNDMDMLEVGNGGMTMEEYRSHFSIWAALKSPLLLGNSPTLPPNPSTFEIVSNPEVIAVHQDRLGVSAFHRAQLDDIMLWIGALKNGDRLLLVLNSGNTTNVDLDIALHAFVLKEEDSIVSHKWRVEVRDLWSRKTLGTFKGRIPVRDVPKHGVKMYRVSKKGADKTFPSLANAPPEFKDHPIKYAQDEPWLPWLFVFGSMAVGVAFALYRIHLQRREGYEQLA